MERLVGWLRWLSLRVAVFGLGVCGLGAVTTSAARATRSPLPPTVRVVLSTANLDHALTPMPNLHFGRAPRGRPVIHVNDRVRYQRITGFGAAMTDSSAWLIQNELTPTARRAVMRELFSRQGIDLSFMRVPMGASDFSATGIPYTYDDLPPGQTDPELQHFSVAHDDAYILPALRQMLAVNPGVEILANPWSPPAWMKANGQLDNVDFAGLVFPAYFPVLADYFVRFIQAYRQAGVPIAAVTPQNEPLVPSSWPGSQLPSPSEALFTASYLRPALSRAGLSTKVYGMDNGNSVTYARQLLAVAPTAFSGIAWHCYGGMGPASLLHQQYPAEDQIVTECSPGIIPYGAAEAAISATRNWASAFVLWNLALDPTGGPVQTPNRGCAGCTGVVTISQQDHLAHRRTNYYQLGQVSKYVHPGAVRIASDRFVSDFHDPAGPAWGVTRGLDNVAFLNRDGTRVLVAVNTSHATIRFAVAWRGLSFRYALPHGATVTFTWK